MPVIPTFSCVKKKFGYFFFFLLVLHANSFAQNDSLKGGEFYASNFLIDEIQRNFIYYMPAHYGERDTYPLIILLHSEGESGKSVIKSFGNIMQQIADTSGFIVIYPDAVNGHWNTGMNKGKDSANDAGFISILIDYFIQVYQANPKQIYLLGFSTGGEMALRTACIVPLKITAIAAFGASQKNSCNVISMDTNSFTEIADKKSYTNAIANAWKFFMATKK
jgi:polyhydroxybutyrate depolymerase